MTVSIQFIQAIALVLSNQESSPFSAHPLSGRVPADNRPPMHALPKRGSPEREEELLRGADAEAIDTYLNSHRAVSKIPLRARLRELRDAARVSWQKSLTATGLFDSDLTPRAVLRVRCPRCAAKAHQPCAGPRAVMQDPHRERIRAANRRMK